MGKSIKTRNSCSELVHYSDLDSARFEIRVARSTVSNSHLPIVFDWCDHNEVDLLIVRVSFRDESTVNRLARDTLRHMETLVHWVLTVDVALPSTQLSPYQVRVALHSDSDVVRSLARAVFRGYVGHYRNDPRLDNAACDEVYADWAARNCLQASGHYHTLVADLDGELVGFSTLKLNEKRECETVLSGVAPQIRQRGVFRALHECRLDWCSSMQVKRLRAFTVTANTPMSQCYEGAGFVPLQRLGTFHRWFR